MLTILFLIFLRSYFVRFTIKYLLLLNKDRMYYYFGDNKGCFFIYFMNSKIRKAQVSDFYFLHFISINIL